MKRILGILLALSLVLSAPALAESDGYWTDNDDIYYHALENCGGIEGRVPISLEGAAEFEKYPCPVCVPVADDGRAPTAAARGNVIVARFSDAWLAGHESELTGVFGMSGTSVLEGEAAQRKLAELVHGEEYARALSGEAVMEYTPAIYKVEDLSMRHIGCAWYILALPNDGFGARWDMEWVAFAGEVSLKDGALTLDADRQTVNETLSLDLELLHDSEPEYVREGEPEIHVYAALDAHLAVVHESNPDVNRLEDVELRIGGSSCGPMQGREQGGQALYYCALTDGELAALRSGAQAELWHEPDNANADYMGGPYAAAVYGTSQKMGIVDRDGNYVVEPEYDYIYRWSAEEAHAVAPTPFFCNRKGGGSAILDGDTLEVLFECARNSYYENPAVFRELEDASAFWSGEPCAFRSMADGSALFEYAGQDACGWWPDAGYRVLAEGMPQRMVAVKGDGADAQMSLIDNHGELIPGAIHQRITALYWRGERGVFLAEKFDPQQYRGAGFGESRSYYDLNGGAYDGRACYGEDWRCGLIDQDGNALTELKYVSVACATDGTIALIGEDGEIETVKFS